MSTRVMKVFYTCNEGFLAGFHEEFPSPLSYKFTIICHFLFNTYWQCPKILIDKLPKIFCVCAMLLVKSRLLCNCGLW